ncbi:LPXTG cell wall anchor domain-containing protein [Erysipelotrichaceae bacterium HCN-30851]
MKKIIKGASAIILSSLFLFPTNIDASTAAFKLDEKEEGTGSVQVLYEKGKENEIPLGEGEKSPNTGSTSNLNSYLTILTSSLLLVLLLLYHREKEKESN